MGLGLTAADAPAHMDAAGEVAPRIGRSGELSASPPASSLPSDVVPVASSVVAAPVAPESPVLEVEPANPPAVLEVVEPPAPVTLEPADPPPVTEPADIIFPPDYEPFPREDGSLAGCYCEDLDPLDGYDPCAEAE